MGRDVTGLRVSSVKAKPAVLPKTSTEIPQEKAALVKEGVIVASPNENSNAKHDALGVKSPNLEDTSNDLKSSNVEETKSNSPNKSGVGMTSLENVQPKHSAKKALDATGDQHGGSSPTQAETPGLCRNTSPRIDVQPSPSSSKKSQTNAPSISRKLLDDDDNWSTGSSTTASVRAARFKTTVPVAPKFTVTQRLEKRKEFYTKLEEKHKALEAEKTEYEARNKEEEQAAIKQLRKAMVYKANPVPNFYYEGPPPKKELKKPPTTRAVSPKIGRRRSCGDATSTSAEQKAVCARAARYSLGSYSQNHKQCSVASTSTPKKKAPASDHNGKTSLKKKASASSPAQAKESVAVPENTNIAVHS